MKHEHGLEERRRTGEWCMLQRAWHMEHECGCFHKCGGTGEKAKRFSSSRIGGIPNKGSFLRVLFHATRVSV